MQNIILLRDIYLTIPSLLGILKVSKSVLFFKNERPSLDLNVQI